MNVPTPLNDHTRDDRFNRGLTRLLDGDPRGIDDIDPDLQDVAVQMVALANDAGWVGSEPGASRSVGLSRRKRLSTIINALAAVLLVGLIGSMVMLGMQVWGPGDGHYGAGNEDQSVAVDLGPGVCSRAPRTDAEIASIVRKTEAEVMPFQSNGVVADITGATMQLTRDWNACLQAGMWDRAMAYESDHLLWSFGQDVFPNGTSGMTDADIAARLRERHAEIKPIETPDGLNLVVYSAETLRYRHEGVDANEGPFVLGVDLWLVPVDANGDWVEWPTVVTSEWDGGQWVIVATTQEGIPESPFRRDDTLPATPGP